MKQATINFLIPNIQVSSLATIVALSLGTIAVGSTLLPQGAIAQQHQAQNHASTPSARSKYSQIASGMTYQQVVAVLGNQGEEASRSEANGISIVLYNWQYSDGIIGGVFKNNKLLAKSFAPLLNHPAIPR